MHAVSTNFAKPTPKWCRIVTSQTAHIQLHWSPCAAPLLNTLLEFLRGAHNQAVIPGITRPLHATDRTLKEMSLKKFQVIWQPYTRLNVEFLPLRLCYQKTRTCFSKDAENLATCGYGIRCSQIVCIRPYSLNTTIAFHSVNVWSNLAVSVWLMACHVTI